MKSVVTLYRQIYDKLLEDITNGLYDNGKQLPTEAEVAKQYFVSRITSKKALTQLAEDGVIVRIPGRGSFVKKDFSASIPLPTRPKESGIPHVALVMGGYSSSFGLELLNGALDAAEELGMHLILKNTLNDQKRESRIIKSLMASGVAGIIIQPAHGELYNEALLKAVYAKYPIVMIDRSMAGIDVPFIGVDNVNLSRHAVTKLILSGHRNICLLALEDDHSSSLKERMQGFLEAFAGSRLAVKRDLWLTRMNAMAKSEGVDYNDPAAHETYVDIVAAHLMRHPEITAVFGTEYFVARAAWDAVLRIGKRVPEDISIASFDFDSEYLGSNLLSHVRQPQTAIGKCAVRVMNDILKGKAPDNRCFLLEGEWVDGNSIASLK